jgi:ABC-2 type transport system ATP-binding protein
MTDGLGAIAEVSGLGFSYGARRALDGIDLRLDAGRLYALVGPNGAGKTTLVRTLTGRLTPERGSVSICGGDPRRDRAARARLGLVPQEIALYDELTARENLVLLGRLAGLSRRGAAEAARRGLEWIGLSERRASPAGQLSGGMRRRLNIAAGALHEPRLLILDEPTVGIDPRAREKIHRLLRDLRGRGVAILLATHDLAEAEGLADEVVVLDEGRVRAIGAPERLIQRFGGGGPELIVDFDGAPSDEDRRALGELGLSEAGPDGRRWAARLDRADGSAAVWQALVQAGVRPREFRLRPPDLRTVFFSVTGKEIES